MPLEKGKSNAVRSHNIAELIKAGHDPKQAAAIAFKESGEDDETGKTFKIYDKNGNPVSAREYDLNGWPEIKENPISKVGVFPYMGRDISPDLEPNQVYNVYRPEEELSSAETIESFKLLPFVDEHAMLGSEDEGMLPAEKKGIHGIIGADVFYQDGYLKGNIKIFSDKLGKLIEDGKKELSIGYRCLYDMVAGVYNGIKYDAIQREIRGNHLALVDEGRSGPDVAVLDHFKITMDTKELKMPEMKKEGEIQDEEMSLEACVKMVKELAEKVNKMMKSEDEENMELKEEKEGEGEAKKELASKAEQEGDKKAKDAQGEYKKFVNKAESSDEESEPDSREEEEMSQDDKPGDMSKPKDKKGMDSKTVTRAVFNELAKRDALAKKLSDHIGVFDHSLKTFQEVAQYGAKKLGLQCEPGQEVPMVEGYLLAAKKNRVVATTTDSSIKSDCVTKYLNGGK